MPFAKGRRAKLIDDRSGFAIEYTRALKDWNGMMVDPSEWDGEHPQQRKRRIRADAQALRRSRSEPTSTAIDQQLRVWMANASQGNIPQTFGPTG